MSRKVSSPIWQEIKGMLRAQVNRKPDGGNGGCYLERDIIPYVLNVLIPFLSDSHEQLTNEEWAIGGVMKTLRVALNPSKAGATRV